MNRPVSLDKRSGHPLLGGWGDLMEDLLRLQRRIASVQSRRAGQVPGGIDSRSAVS